MLTNATNSNTPYLPPLTNSGNKRVQNMSNASNYVNNAAANNGNINGSLSTLNSYSNVPQAQNYMNKPPVNTSNTSINDYQNIPTNYTNTNRNFNPNGSPSYVNASQAALNANLHSINENDPYGPYAPPNSNPYVNAPNNNSRSNVNASNSSNYNRISPADQYKNQNVNPNAVNLTNKDYNNSLVNLNGPKPSEVDKSKETNKSIPNQTKPATNLLKPVTNAPKANNAAAAENKKPVVVNSYSNQNKNKSNFNNISNINSLINKSSSKNNNNSNNETAIAFNTKVPALKNNTPNKNKDFIQRNREQQSFGRNKDKDAGSNYSDIDSTDTLSPVTYGGSIGSDSVDKPKSRNPLTLSQRDKQLGIKPKKPSPAQNNNFSEEIYTQYTQPATMPRYYGNVLPVAVPYYYPHPPPPALGYAGYPYGFRGTPPPLPPTVKQPRNTNKSNEKTRIMAPPIAVMPYYVPPEVQYLHAPPIVNDKDPSLHDLLYYDKFKSTEGSYVSKHIEKKIRNLDGFYHPFERHTIEDYRQLKANQGFKDSFGRSIIDYDPETRDDKIEKMQKRKEMGNLFSRSNPKPKKKIGEEGTMKGAKSENDLLHSTSTRNLDHSGPNNARTRASEYSKNVLARSNQDSIYDDLNPRSRGARYDNDEDVYFTKAFLQSDLPQSNYDADARYQFEPNSNYYDD